MCGIVGYLFHPQDYCEKVEENIIAACQAISHRGPDDHGTILAEKWALGHVRLSILDLSKQGHQPMQTEDERYTISYNGEVYNYLEIRKELELLGFFFQSQTDTEVILKAFKAWGKDSFVKFNGMFAFTIVDTVENKAWLVRDRFGIKPLYYVATEHNFIFSSEIKAIHILSPDLPVLASENLAEFVYYGNNLGEKTLFKNIQKLLPGHYLEVDIEHQTYEDKVYWKLEDVKPVSYNNKTTVDEIKTLLENSVKRQLVSDVPVGIFLSGGIDSSAVTAFASKHYSGPLNTYSVGFDFDKGVNELPKARNIAKLFNTQHHEIIIDGYSVADTVVDLVSYHDLPFSDAANIPLYLLCKEIKKSDCIKVILQGDGGDEFFGGYQRHSTLATTGFPALRKFVQLFRFLLDILPASSGVYRLKRFINAIASEDDGKLMALLLTVEDEHNKPEDIFSTSLLNKIQQANPFQRYIDQNKRFSDHALLQKMLFIDTQIILPDIFLEKVDRATMAASIEIRVPFLDNDLTEYMLGLPGKVKVKGNAKKYLLKKALEDILPHDILYGPKTGFGVPFGYWIKGPLKELLFDTLTDLESMQSNIFDYNHIKRLYEDHCSGSRDNGFLLWKVLNFALWLKQHKLYQV